MSIPYLYTSETKLMRQVAKDLARHEGFREYAYPDPLSKIGKKYRGNDWQWGFVPARVLLAKIKGAKDEDGGPWTVGYGFTHNVTPDSRISRIAADRMLENLILQANGLLSMRLYWYKDATF